MEIPYNTTIVREMKARGERVAPVATWKEKREWVGYAFAELENAGYTVGSAYTAVKDPSRTRFVYRDQLWRGADLIGLGVASFSHVGGTHFQNEHDFDPYLARLQRDELPIYRALTPSWEERMIREFILQMKLGHVDRAYFEAKFNVDIYRRFADPLQALQDQNLLVVGDQEVRLNRPGLLQVDRLLYDFFLPEHRTTRYA
jgi:oxygen-independent coproporphyrinogen-3 oxidase